MSPAGQVSFRLHLSESLEIPIRGNTPCWEQIGNVDSDLFGFDWAGISLSWSLQYRPSDIQVFSSAIDSDL
jgi:hypothetical protein